MHSNNRASKIDHKSDFDLKNEMAGIHPLNYRGNILHGCVSLLTS